MPYIKALICYEYGREKYKFGRYPKGSKTQKDTDYYDIRRRYWGYGQERDEADRGKLSQGVVDQNVF